MCHHVSTEIIFGKVHESTNAEVSIGQYGKGVFYVYVMGKQGERLFLLGLIDGNL